MVDLNIYLRWCRRFSSTKKPVHLIVFVFSKRKKNTVKQETIVSLFHMHIIHYVLCDVWHLIGNLCFTQFFHSSHLHILSLAHTIRNINVLFWDFMCCSNKVPHDCKIGRKRWFSAFFTKIKILWKCRAFKFRAFFVVSLLGYVSISCAHLKNDIFTPFLAPAQ